MVRHRPSRTGFTLIELLMVILIIAALIAILVPTVFAAFRKAKEAQVTAEINNLATALASFKNTYGDYPPSRIILCERGYNFAGVLTNNGPASPLADGNCGDMTVAQLAQRSLLYLRKFWPRADFLGDPGANATPGNFNDFDGNGVVNSLPIVLTGSECLTFFLGGLPIHAGGGITGMSGFSKSATLPFVDPTVALNRTVPNYEFNNSRLIDQDGDQIPSYIDPINIVPGSRRGYAYFVSYGVNGYDPNDVNGYGHIQSPVYELEEDLSTTVERGFLVNFPVTGSHAPLAVSPGPNPYTSGPAATGTVSWFNPTSFQIICAGQDGYWGLGGTYSASGGAQGRLPILPAPPAGPPNDPGNINADDTTGVRLREADNLTNFSGGRLD
jgi:general secretion pathway protein G